MNNSRTEAIFFDNISIENGLSQITVHSILKDELGFIWIATEDGLNRFDGISFKIYRNSRNSNNSISDNFIWTLFLDDQSKILIGTNSGGLNIFDQRSGKFQHFKRNENDISTISSNSIRTILKDSRNNYWIGTEGGGLNRFEMSDGVFERFLSSNEFLTVYSIIEKSPGELLLGTENGLFLFEQDKFRFSQILFLDNSIEKSSVQVNALHHAGDNGDKFLIGTNEGLNYYSFTKGSIALFNSREGFTSGNEIVTSFAERSKNEIAVGTEGGLYFFSPLTGRVYQHHHPNNRDIYSNIIKTIFVDDQKNIWIGTAEMGVQKHSPNKKSFYHISYDPRNQNSLSHNMIRSIFEDSEGNIWIGTLGGGLNLFSPYQNKFTHFRNNPMKVNSLSSDGVTAIHQDREGVFWIGTWGGGLNRMTFNSGRSNFKRYISDPENGSTISGNIVQAVLEDSYGNLWVGTENGLNLFNKNSSRFVRVVNIPDDDRSISDNRIQSNSIFQDESGNLWVGTWNGLNKLKAEQLEKLRDPREYYFEKFLHDPSDSNSLSDNRVISIFEDSRNNLWVGTHGGGLNILSIDSGMYKIESFRESDGLPSDVIYGIVEDESGALWLSTNFGLSKFQYDSGEFLNFFHIDGLQSNQFYWGASSRSRDGTIYFGGINGINYFNPADFKENPDVPPVHITGIKILNETVSMESKSEIIANPILFTRKIELEHNQNLVTFEFRSLDYTLPQKNRFKYRLNGVENDWHFSRDSRSVSYTLSEPGTYIFEVHGSNNDGVWNTQGDKIEIIFLPPFYNTVWFKLLLILILGTPFVYLILSYFKQLIAVERLRAKLAADLHDSIGSSLTEISILSEVLSVQIPEKNKEAKKGLGMISEKSRTLVDDMSDIVWLVNPKRDSLYDLILRLQDSYSEILSFKGISIKSENLKSLERVSLPMDQRQNLYLIFKEGINNAINHSGCEEILLNAEISGRMLKMELIDDGNGFETGKKHSGKGGDGLGNMKERAKKIHGTLEIESESGEGTKIKFEGRIL